MRGEKRMKIINSKKMLFVDSIVLMIAIVLDQITKFYLSSIKENSPFVIITDVLELRYHENRGAAFGILQGQRVFFVFMAIVVFCIMTFIILRIPKDKKYVKLNISLVLILAGAIGNTIDRVLHGYVTDFIYFKIIDFPIFNVADMYITISTFWIVIMIFFCFKEEDLEFINFFPQKNTRDANYHKKEE